MSAENVHEANMDGEGELQEVYLSSGSSFHLSASSNPSPNSSDSNSERRPRSRKRKTRDTSLDGARARSKRIKSSYHVHYLELFNQTVRDIARGTPSIKPMQWDTSRIGGTIWSSKEKQSLFKCLEASAHSDLATISHIVGTKTPPEIRDFIHLLEEAKVYSHLRDKRERLLDASIVPAAFEMSDECDAVLEEAADALALYQKREDGKLEKERHGNDWLLTRKVAEEINKSLNSGPDGEVKVAKTVPSAVLLDPKVFLTLSSRLFMNSSDQSYNWQSFAEGRERPSIFHTAFSDLANLVLTVTERLVQSILFIAMARLRASDASKYSASRYVKTIDVESALEVVGMRAGSHNYWVGVPRRCKLDVFEGRGRNRKRKISGERMDYDEVEVNLARSRDERGDYSRSTPHDQSGATSFADDTSSMTSLRSSSTEDGDQFEVGSEEEVPSSAALSDSDLTFASTRSIRQQNRFDHEQLAYMSAIDARDSLEEEQRLWALLDKNPLTTIDPEAVEIPRNPGPERKTQEDLASWRKATHYCPPWEMHESLVPSEAFVVNQNTWRRRKRKVSQWEDIELLDQSESESAGEEDTKPDDEDDLSESESSDFNFMSEEEDQSSSDNDRSEGEMSARHDDVSGD